MSWVGLILAAGQSSRFGSPKALAIVKTKFENKTLIHSWVELFEKCGAQHCFIVINEKSGPEIQRSLESEAVVPTMDAKITWVLQNEPTAAPFSSLQKGVIAIQKSGLTIARPFDEEFDGAFFTPVDILPSAETTIQKILHHFFSVKSDKSSNIVLSKKFDELFAIRPVCKSKRGHPVFLSQRILNEIVQLDPDKDRLDELLRRYQNNVVDLPVEDENIFSNLNTPDQLLVT